MLSYCTRNPCWCCHWVGSMNFENFWDKIELRHCKSIIALCQSKCALAEGTRGIPASLYNEPQQLSYQPVITADIGRAGWPALVQIKGNKCPCRFLLQQECPCRFLSYHVGNSASMSPVEFSKRPMSAVANYPFHTPYSKLPGFSPEFFRNIKFSQPCCMYS